MKAETADMDKSTSNWLTKNALLLGLVSFFADLSGEMMTPILPLFIVAIGGTTAAVGFIGGLGDATASFMRVLSGYIADRVGHRRELILTGYSIPFLAKFGIGLSNSWEQVVVLKPVERLGKGIRGAPRDSLLSDSGPEEYRGKVFGFHRMMDTAGAVIGTFVALILLVLFFDVLQNVVATLQVIIIVSAFVSLLAVIPILFLQEPARSVTRKLRKTSLGQNLRDLPVDYYKFLLVSAVFGLANFTILLFVLQAKNIVPVTESDLVKITVPVVIFIWFNLAYTALSIPFGNWSDKKGRKTVFVIGIILFIVTCGGFLIAGDLLMLLVVFAIYGAFNAATDGIQKAFTVDLVPETLKGTGLGLLQMVTGLATIIAGVIAGFLMSIDPSLAFIYGGIMAFVALLLILLLKIQIPEKKLSNHED
ncbi:MAG: MFS transporter [Candidatus Hodarchaeales archaeon]|jgi:MFS family permease